VIGNRKSGSEPGSLYPKEIDQANNSMTSPVLDNEVLTPTARRQV